MLQLWGRAIDGQPPATATREKWADGNQACQHQSRVMRLVGSSLSAVLRIPLDVPTTLLARAEAFHPNFRL